MINDHQQFLEILKFCTFIDAIAASVYAKFAENCSDPVLKKEWESCAADERQHVKFWKRARKLVFRSELPEVFEKPELIRNSLEKNYLKFKKNILEMSRYDDINEALILTYHLEAFMLDPEMLLMLNYFKSVDRRISENYNQHINKFIDMLGKYGGESSHLAMLGETLGKLYRRNQELIKQCTIDPLSGILNRRGFFNSIEPFVSMAKRDKSNIGIIMGDIDNFKMINDKFGHPMGDRVIAATAGIFSESIRQSDICGRYGGEEFIVFLNLKKKDSLEKICQRINAGVKENLPKDPGIATAISLGASYGQIIISEEQDLAFIIHRADQNLLQAKKNGKDCWVIG